MYIHAAAEGYMFVCVYVYIHIVVVWLFIGTQNRLVTLHSALFPRLT